MIDARFSGSELTLQETLRVYAAIEGRVVLSPLAMRELADGIDRVNARAAQNRAEVLDLVKHVSAFMKRQGARVVSLQSTLLSGRYFSCRRLSWRISHEVSISISGRGGCFARGGELPAGPRVRPIPRGSTGVECGACGWGPGVLWCVFVCWAHHALLFARCSFLPEHEPCRCPSVGRRTGGRWRVQARCRPFEFARRDICWRGHSALQGPRYLPVSTWPRCAICARGLFCGRGGGMTRALVTADAQFRALWASDASAADVAARYGVTAAVVRQCAKRAGLPPKTLAAPVDRDLLRKLWQAEVPRPEIARQLGCSTATVSHLAHGMGLTSRKAAFHLDDFTLEKVAPLWFSALSRAALADALGCSEKRLADLRKAYRLPSRLHFCHYTSARFEQLMAEHAAEFEGRRVPRDTAPKAKPVPRVGGAPFWTPERDAQVFATQGRYAALRAAARGLGKPVQYVQARWHQLRVAA